VLGNQVRTDRVLSGKGRSQKITELYLWGYKRATGDTQSQQVKFERLSRGVRARRSRDSSDGGFGVCEYSRFLVKLKIKTGELPEGSQYKNSECWNRAGRTRGGGVVRVKLFGEMRERP